MGDKYTVVCKDKFDKILILDYIEEGGVVNKRPALYNLDKIKSKQVDMTYEEMKVSKSDICAAFVEMYRDKTELLGDEHHLFNAYRCAFDLCKEKIKRYKLKSYILFGEFTDSPDSDDIKIVKFRLNGKNTKVEVKTFNEKQKVLENYTDIIVRLFKFNTKILKQLESIGYYSTILHPGLDGKNVESKISTLMFGKANFGKYSIYKINSNIKLESKRFTLFKDISTPIECSHILNEYNLSVEAITRYTEILKTISIEELSRATAIKVEFIKERIRYLEESTKAYTLLIE